MNQDESESGEKYVPWQIKNWIIPEGEVRTKCQDRQRQEYACGDCFEDQHT